MLNRASSDVLDLRTRVWRALVRTVMHGYLVSLRLAHRFRAPRRARPDAYHLLLTGSFHSHNWIRAHLGPLAASRCCARITMITADSLPDLPHVTGVAPPRWLTAAVGSVPARLLTFAVATIRLRPDVVGGFHLLVNGLAAAILAPLAGAQSWYFCVGGITEILDGGVWGENPYFSRLKLPDPVVERQLVEAVNGCDLVITMGSSARADFQKRGALTRFEVVAGGVEGSTLRRRPPPQYDLILVARLVPIKRIDLFLDIVARLRQVRPGLTAAIVGDGPLRQALARRAGTLGVAGAVTFAGRQDDVAWWLARARVFVLTSLSEGLALSLMEAMMVGLPAVVPRIGDLPDLVEDGRNGHLIDVPTAENFAEPIRRLLDEPARYQAFASAARASAQRHTVPAATLKWDTILCRPE